MYTHLHVHLEPNERKRRQVGQARQYYNDAAQFFLEHSLDNPDRLPVDLEDLEHFIREFHAEQRAQGVHYVEVRLSPRRFLSQATTISDVLFLASRVASDLSYPTVRLILLLNRDSSLEFVEACENAIDDGLPHAFVGIDLAGDEVRFPDVHRFKRCFAAALSSGLGATVHAGEFGHVDNIWRALDELGASRIGHCLSVVGHRNLAKRLRDDDVMVEISLTSNVALGAVPSLELHPLPWLLENEVSVCLNSDVPLHLGTGLHEERQLAELLLNSDLQVLRSMEESARRHCFGVLPVRPD